MLVRATTSVRRDPRIAGSTQSVRAAFSLVELVVVVVIIGMLAAMAIPRVSQGASKAGSTALRADVVRIDRAIQFYAIEHGGRYPGPTARWLVDQLTQYSDRTGGISPVKTATHIYGPYLVNFPAVAVGPNAGKKTVLIDTANSPPQANEASGHGWVYNPNTGEIAPNIGTGAVNVDAVNNGAIDLGPD